MTRANWIIGVLGVLVAIFAAWRIEENSALVPATAVVKWISAGMLPKLNVMTIHHFLRPLSRGVVILAI
jgi:hypothetical protein